MRMALQPCRRHDHVGSQCGVVDVPKYEGAVSASIVSMHLHIVDIVDAFDKLFVFCFSGYHGTDGRRSWHCAVPRL